MSEMTLLFCGDVSGRPGRTVLRDHLPELIKKYDVQLTIANGENAAGGFGITPDTAQDLYAAGVDVITLGNHTWDKVGTERQVEEDRKILRPMNYPKGTPGVGFRTYEAKNGKRVGVLSLMGRVFVDYGLDCPFQAARKFMKENRMGEDYDALVVDVHAETTSEKAALGHIFDGRASLVVGTHTHIPTADHRIMPKGTAFMTDVGMCGFYESSLGITFESVLSRFEPKGRGKAFQMDSGPATLSAILVRVNDEGLATYVQPIRVGGVLDATE